MQVSMFHVKHGHLHGGKSAGIIKQMLPRPISPSCARNDAHYTGNAGDLKTRRNAAEQKEEQKHERNPAMHPETAQRPQI